MQAELRHVRDDLLEQRAGLGQLLDEQEDDGDAAPTLHEELARVPRRAFFMRLRAGDLDGSLEDLHRRVRGVSPSCVTLRPRCVQHRWRSSVCRRRWRRSTDSRPSRPTTSRAAPEPLRTGVYRLVEHRLFFAGRRARPPAWDRRPARNRDRRRAERLGGRGGRSSTRGAAGRLDADRGSARPNMSAGDVAACIGGRAAVDAASSVGMSEADAASTTSSSPTTTRSSARGSAARRRRARACTSSPRRGRCQMR